MCPCHGKSDLDRRFSSFTSWINTYQFSNRINSVNEMMKVLQNGAKGSNLQRRELGDEPIPTGFGMLKLKKPTAKAAYVELKMIKSFQCVTYIPHRRDRLKTSDSGYYVNVLPWVPWKRGKHIPTKNVMEGSRAKVLTEKQRTLRKLHKEAGSLANNNDFKVLRKQYEDRLKLLRELKYNLKIMQRGF